MFTKSRRPADTPFEHGEDCKTTDAAPEWHMVSHGYWQRVCSCRTDFQTLPDVGIDPDDPASAPHWTEHRHLPDDCPGASLELVVQVEHLESGGFRSYCPLCTSSWLYWFSEVLDDRGNRVSGSGNMRYVYRRVGDPAPSPPVEARGVA
ncbi:MAG: hypothetical protein ACRDPQ_03540 [Nocardioidaceae bacterium]